jgi:hypothetical protein
MRCVDSTVHSGGSSLRPRLQTKVKVGASAGSTNACQERGIRSVLEKSPRYKECRNAQ